MSSSSNIIPLIQRSRKVASTSWERSLPTGTTSDAAWIVDVLDDLAAFAEFNGLPDVQEELAQVKEKVRVLLD